MQRRCLCRYGGVEHVFVRQLASELTVSRCCRRSRHVGLILASDTEVRMVQGGNGGACQRQV